jgi:hypothetical protein
MTDKPIIFSAPMVRALLDGRKTQTRRMLKPQPKPLPEGMICKWHIPGKHVGFNMTDEQMQRLGPKFAPYYPGDRLYVREAWAKDDLIDTGARYYATDDVSDLRRKRSPIHMPRWASRLTLTVTEVRVQRLQEISEADAVAEGAEPSKREWAGVEEFGLSSDPFRYRKGFQALWNSLHGLDAWDANPWVVAPTFTVQRGNIDAVTS